jgi:SNF2 family DNA or RNA helicase
MLPRQPLRFLLADDPGAGKTIMAGLFIKELIARGDLQRCLVVCPGSLTEQWQDELYRRFQLSFEMLTNDKLEAARTGNWFLENNLVIARLDKLSRDEDVQHKLQAPECPWDLVVCDEAHKLSATFFGGEVKYTKRYHLGQLLSGLTRHFLLMTATPHNGKEEDFQLFLALLDGDRFEGRFRDGVHQVEVSDLMRRMVKENLLKFDGTPLFPERIAYTVPYKLSNAEAELYSEVTNYVRDEFNRAEALANDKRAGTVGFALTILQRRLASSPEAIYQSLHRRSERFPLLLYELPKSRHDEFAVLFGGFVGDGAERIKEYAGGLFIGLRGCGKCALKFCLGHLEEGLKRRFIAREPHAFNKKQFRMHVCMERRPNQSPARLPTPAAIGAIARVQWPRVQSDPEFFAGLKRQ